MSRQAWGNTIAGVLFLVIAVVDFTRDSSGIGVVFLVFAAVFLALGLSSRRAARAERR
jgi:Flp pilus assembly protein TadB